MEKSKMSRIQEIEDNIDYFYNVCREYSEYSEKLYYDTIYLLKEHKATDKEIETILSIITSDFNNINFIHYLLNDEDKTIKDIIRQAYMIENRPIPYESEIKRQKCKLSKEQIKELDDLNVPYSVKEIEKEAKQENTELETDMIIANYNYLNKLAKKTKKSNIKKILKVFENEYMPFVPEKEVKEIHVFFDDFDEEILFLDEEGLHKVVGKKARVRFLNGKHKVGYLGSDFKDRDGDKCLSLYEAFDEYKGFYDYHTYKLKDVLKIDVLCYPRDNIDFGFEIKVRHIKKYVRGVTEKKK